MSIDAESLAQITGSPARVVSLSPGLTESLVDLQFAHTLVGLGESVAAPASLAPLPRLSAANGDLCAKLTALRADLILADGNSPVAPELRAAGLPVWAPAPDSVRAAIDMLWQLIRVFDQPQVGLRISALETTLEWTTLAAQARQPAPVAVLLQASGNGPWIALGGSSYANDLLRVCGARNVLADVHAPRAPATAAQLAAAAPARLLLADEPFESESVDELASQIGVAAANIHQVERGLLLWPGTRLARALQELPPIFNE